MNEIERIKESYKKREHLPAQLYSFFNPGNLFMIQSREREILRLLKKNGIFSLKDRKILDIGCGRGGMLSNFVKYGASPHNLSGIDLLPERIKLAKISYPNINFRCGDASKLPYENSSFDIIMQFTVFTSILYDQMKISISSEMLRVLKQDGFILWYDYHMDNPWNPDVKGVKKKEIYQLFPDCSIYLKRITLLPPLTRLLIPYSLMLCYLLEKIPILCSHYLGLIRKLSH